MFSQNEAEKTKNQVNESMLESQKLLNLAHQAIAKAQYSDAFQHAQQALTIVSGMQEFSDETLPLLADAQRLTALTWQELKLEMSDEELSFAISLLKAADKSYSLITDKTITIKENHAQALANLAKLLHLERADKDAWHYLTNAKQLLDCILSDESSDSNKYLRLRYKINNNLFVLSAVMERKVETQQKYLQAAINDLEKITHKTKAENILLAQDKAEYDNLKQKIKFHSKPSVNGLFQGKNPQPKPDDRFTRQRARSMP